VGVLLILPDGSLTISVAIDSSILMQSPSISDRFVRGVAQSVRSELVVLREQQDESPSGPDVC
jgi:hypothetical protein